MILKAIQLRNFRNYDSLEMEFSDGITALIGENAQGKTNLLEGIAFLAVGKSFRGANFLETLMWDRPHGGIKARLESKGKEKEMEVFIERETGSKKVKKQGKVVAPKAFMGTLRAVLFAPDNLQMIGGSPRLRRQYFDRLLIQLSSEYLQTFSEYQHVLKQRNALLKRVAARRASECELDVWDEKMLPPATLIWKHRSSFATFINSNLSEIYTSISASNENIAFEYEPRIERFDEQLIAARPNDIRFSTSIGPHRDDFKVRINGRDIAESGSRGEQRSAVLALKIAEIRYIEKMSGVKPILLLDDVFSELDEERQAHLCKLVESYQTVITSCHIENLKNLKNARVFKIESGAVTPA